MKTHHPEAGPSAAAWLGIGDAKRIALVESDHRRRRIRVPQLTIHATIQVVVGNQIMLGKIVVNDPSARLRAE